MLDAVGHSASCALAYRRYRGHIARVRGLEGALRSSQILRLREVTLTNRRMRRAGKGQSEAVDAAAAEYRRVNTSFTRPNAWPLAGSIGWSRRRSPPTPDVLARAGSVIKTWCN